MSSVGLSCNYDNQCFKMATMVKLMREVSPIVIEVYNKKK